MPSSQIVTAAWDIPLCERLLGLRCVGREDEEALSYLERAQIVLIEAAGTKSPEAATTAAKAPQR